MSKKKGRIYTYSIIHIGPTNLSKQVPYVVAVVEDEDGRFLTRIDGFMEGLDIQIGSEVEFLRNDEMGRPIYSIQKN